jgi:hypothetical protein
LLDVFDAIRHDVEDGEVAIDHGIEEGVDLEGNPLVSSLRGFLPALDCGLDLGVGIVF